MPKLKCISLVKGRVPQWRWVRAMRGAVVVPGCKEQAELLDVLVLSGCRLKQVCPLAAHMQSAQSALMDG